MKIAMSVLGVRGAVRRAHPGPGRRRRRPQVPRGLLRGLDALLRGPVDRRRVARARDRRRRLDPRHRARLLFFLRSRARRGGAAGPPRPASTTSSRTSGTSTRRSTSSSSARRWRSGAGPTRPSSATSSRAWSVGATGAAKGANAAVRTAQSGYLRSYALLLFLGFAGLGLYFLVAGSCHDPGRSSGSRSPPALLACLAPRRIAPGSPTRGRPRHAGPRGRCWSPTSTPASPASSTPSTRPGSPTSASATRSASTGSASSWCCSPPSPGSRPPPGRRSAPPSGAKTYFLMLGLAETATLGAFLAQDLLLFVLFFDLMLIPFYFLFGSWGSEHPGRDWEGTISPTPATIKMIVYTLVGSLLMLAGAIAAGVIAGDGGTPVFSMAELRGEPARRGQPGLDLLVLRRGLPGQDAGLPGPRLDARRLPGGAAAGAGRLLRGALEGRAPTASCGSCCRSSPTPRSSSRR